ncbi:bile acid:sodium symporter family protein [Microcella alkalica]|uniref:bile acid:sodium symporter family protein n=1 Tax=Microcella alkalica TaxID=355930 RepID=UPI001B7D0044|nr:bile acid:sodium symporter family protein [Microcella alkalica]
MSAASVIAAQAGISEQDVVTPFEQNLLVGLVFVIMFGLGAGLTPRDFKLALKRPAGLIIGFLTQFGIMPVLAYVLCLAFLFQLAPEYAVPVAIGALLMGSVPAGTTSNMFTYFSKGNLALSVMMTTNSTLWAIVMTPLALAIFGGLLFTEASEFEIPIGNIIATIALLLIPVVLGMLIRRFSANIGAVLELLGGFFGLFFIVFLLATWVPRNWGLLTSTPWQTYVVSIGLGLFGILIAYGISKAIRLHPANARTIALETGIQNGPLAIAIILLTYSGSPDIGLILIVPALYSLFIVLISTVVTIVFRRANTAAEQKIPNLL